MLAEAFIENIDVFLATGGSEFTLMERPLLTLEISIALLGAEVFAWWMFPGRGFQKYLFGFIAGIEISLAEEESHKKVHIHIYIYSNVENNI